MNHPKIHAYIYAGLSEPCRDSILTGSPPKVAYVETVKDASDNPHIFKALELICGIAGITRAQFEGKCRKRPVVNARRVFTHFMKQNGFSQKKSGHLMGHADHCGANWFLQTNTSILETDEAFKQFWDKCQAELELMNEAQRKCHD